MKKLKATERLDYFASDLWDLNTSVLGFLMLWTTILAFAYVFLGMVTGALFHLDWIPLVSNLANAFSKDYSITYTLLACLWIPLAASIVWCLALCIVYVMIVKWIFKQYIMAWLD